MVLFRGKRGVSPLIATILLIAFAVALGAVIMQFGEAVTGVCGTNIVIQPTACVNADGSIKFSIKNAGSDEITSLKVEAKGISSSNVRDFQLKIAQGSAKEGSIPFSSSMFGELQSVTFIPEIDSTKCTNNAITVNTPKAC